MGVGSGLVLRVHSLSPRRVAVGASQRGMGSTFVHQDEVTGIDSLGYHNLPSRPQELVALGRLHAPFLRVRSIGRNLRHTVELLTGTPTIDLRLSRSRRG